MIDGGVTDGVLPDEAVEEEPEPDEADEPALLELLPVELLPVDVVPVVDVLPVNALTALFAALVTVPTAAEVEGVVVELVLALPCANGLCAGPLRRDVLGLDCTFSVGSDVPVAGGGVGRDACGCGVELEDLESRTGTATIAASNTTATGQSFF